MARNPLPAPPNFDRVARLYRWAEYLALGPILQRTRLSLLDSFSHCRQALLFGDGDGRFLARLLARCPELRATAVDTSAAMLRLLQTQCERTSPVAAARLTTVHASALDATIPPATDLIVTHFFLDCLSQPEVDCIVDKVAASVQPGTLWLLSDFDVPASPLLRGVARLYIRSLYLAFRLLTGLRVQRLPDPQAALTRAKFRRVERRTRLLGLLYSELWVFCGRRDRGSDESRNPPKPHHIHNRMVPTARAAGVPTDPKDGPADPLPDPEPIAPSLEEPDPGVFHHEPAQTPSSDTHS